MTKDHDTPAEKEKDSSTRGDAMGDGTQHKTPTAMAERAGSLHGPIREAIRAAAAVSSPDCRCLFRKGSLVKLCALCQGTADEMERALLEIPLIAAAPQMYQALKAFVEEYVRIANSGDCGNWDPEEETHVINARKALATADGREGRDHE